MLQGQVFVLESFYVNSHVLFYIKLHSTLLSFIKCTNGATSPHSEKI